MGNSCSGCRFNVCVKDPDINVVSCSCPKHGKHSPSASACADFKPIESDQDRADTVALDIMRKAIAPSHSSDLLDTTRPILGYVVAIAVVMMLAVLAFPTTSGSTPISIPESLTSIGTILPMLLILIALMVGIGIVAKPAS